MCKRKLLPRDGLHGEELRTVEYISSAGIIRIRFAGRKLQVFLSARRTGSPCMGNDVFVRMSITKVWRVVKRSERGERDELGKPGERGK